jgi:plasmid stabilization system protein ParE
MIIARDSSHYADLHIQRLLERAEKAASMPSRGHPVHELPDAGLREVHEGNHRIIYRVLEDELQIVTLIHMKQRLPPQRLQ